MLHTFAHRHDRRVGSHHVVIDHDAAFDIEPGALGQSHGGPDTHRHDNDIGGDFGAVLELYARNVTVRPGDLGGIRAGQDHLSAPFQFFLEQPACGLVELTLHQRRHQVDDGDGHAAQREAMRCLQPEQAATDYHRPSLLTIGAPLLGGGEHLVDVVEVAERDDAGQVLARDRNDEGIRAGGDQQLVIGLDPSARGDHGLARTVDLHHRIAGNQLDAVVLIPGSIVDHDLVEGLLASQHRREHDAVVIHPRLGPEDGDIVAGGIAGKNFLDRAAAGHAVADDDEPLAQLPVRPGSPETHRRIHFGSPSATRKRRKAASNRSIWSGTGGFVATRHNCFGDGAGSSFNGRRWFAWTMCNRMPGGMASSNCAVQQFPPAPPPLERRGLFPQNATSACNQNFLVFTPKPRAL